MSKIAKFGKKTQGTLRVKFKSMSELELLSTLFLLKVLMPWALGFFTYSSFKERFTSIVGLEGNRSYNYQSLQIRNIGFWVWGGVGNCQSFQNIIITILNHEHFSHGMSTFNGNNVFHVWRYLTKPPTLWNLEIFLEKTKQLMPYLSSHIEDDNMQNHL
jgi:hypothetical protein